MVVDETQTYQYPGYGDMPAASTVVVWGLAGLAAWWLIHRMLYTHHVL